MSLPLPGRILPLAPGTFRALRHRDFRLLWTGLLVTLTGRWMQSVAQGWLVLRLSDSAFQLGLVGFLGSLPALLLSLPAGVIADRLPRRTTLLWTQVASMLLALVLAALTWLGWVRVWHVGVLAFATGVAGTLDIPVRQSLLQDLVGRDDLPNAIALNSLAFNLSRMIGPGIAGLMLVVTSEAAVFGVTAVAYVALVAAIRALGHRPAVPPAERTSWIALIRGGLDHALHEPRIRIVLVLVVVTSVFGTSYGVLLPIFARDVYGVGSHGLGWMMSVTGLGAVGGALALAGRHGRIRAGRTVGVAMFVLGSSLVAFASTRSYPLALVLLVLIGGSTIVQMATSNTMLQMLAPAELRGRIISLYLLAFMGMSPFGALLAGWLARHIGTPRTVFAGGAICALTALWFSSRVPALRAAAGEAERRWM